MGAEIVANRWQHFLLTTLFPALRNSGIETPKTIVFTGGVEEHLHIASLVNDTLDSDAHVASAGPPGAPYIGAAVTSLRNAGRLGENELVKVQAYSSRSSPCQSLVAASSVLDSKAANLRGT